MSFSNTFLLANRVLKQLIRDHRTIGMIIVMPILITFVFGYAIGGTVEHVPVAIVINDKGINLLSKKTNVADSTKRSFVNICLIQYPVSGIGHLRVSISLIITELGPYYGFSQQSKF